VEKLRDKYEAWGQDAIYKVQFTDNVTFEVSFGLVPAPTGNLTPGVMLILTLQHNLLIGVPPVILPFPAPSLSLGQDYVANAALSLLESARQVRDQANAAPAQAQGLPSGLVKG
jgi:hypothetical protein